MNLRWLRSLALVLAGILVWATFTVVATVHDWWRQPIAPRGDVDAFGEAARLVAEDRLAGNIAMALLSEGRVVAQHFASIAAEERIAADTVFQVASLSKWVTAWGVWALVDRGLVDLDAPVETYLTRWRLPPSAYDHDGVTIRRLLSHTSGLVDGLGYGGFVDPSAVQPIEASLSRAADADPAGEGAVRVGLEPGTVWRYSGGGYTILQLLIEEVSGLAFDEYMRAVVFEPLGMARSSYRLERTAEDELAAHFFGGVRVPHRHFTATAAAALHTTVGDLARFLSAHLEGGDGEPAGRGVISEGAVAAMTAPHGSVLGIGMWGAGPMLFGPVLGRPRVVGHDGFNAPGISTTARLDLASGDGIVVLSSGDPRLGPDLGAAWFHHHLGSRDIITVSDDLGRTALLIAGGAVVIIGSAIAAAFARRGRERE